MLKRKFLPNYKYDIIFKANFFLFFLLRTNIGYIKLDDLVAFLCDPDRSIVARV